jgi:hypothetical protein
MGYECLILIERRVTYGSLALISNSFSARPFFASASLQVPSLECMAEEGVANKFLQNSQIFLRLFQTPKICFEHCDLLVTIIDCVLQREKLGKVPASDPISS